MGKCFIYIFFFIFCLIFYKNIVHKCNKDIKMSYVIDQFIADNINASLVSSMNLSSDNLEFRSLTITGDIENDPNAPNFNFESVKKDYSDNWNPGWSATNKAFLLDRLETGATLSSGKVAVVSSFDQIDVQRCVISAESRYANGTYYSNVIEPFYVNSLKFFHTALEDQLVYVEKQHLNMKSSILNTEYKVIDRVNGKVVDVITDLYTPRQIPYTTMQSITVKNINDLESVIMYHEAYAKDNLKDVTFNNNTIHSIRNNGENVAVYILSGKGYTQSSSRTDKDSKEVAFASAYVMEEPEYVENIGFNVYTDNQSKCYNSFRVKFKNELNNEKKNNIHIHVFSCIMTENDFPFPLDEAKKLVLTLYMGNTSPLASFNKIRADHVMAWNKIWKTNIIISPKSGITAEKEEKIKKINRFIKTALYNIYSYSREMIYFDPSSKNMAILDVNGNIANEGDIWFLPLLMFIKPKVARSVLDFRYKTLNIAQQIAGSYGFQGAKFPYVDNMSNTKDGVYWESITPLTVFNNCMIAVNTWNFYRVSRDKQWLSSYGFEILKNVADFIVGVAEYDSENDSYDIKNVMGLNGTESKSNNSFTHNLARLAIRFAIEAAYELTYFVREKWLEIYLQLDLVYVDDNKRQIIKFDALSIEEEMYNIIEVFFILTPYYSKIFFGVNEEKGFHKTPEIIKKNLDYYITRIKSRYEFHPYNITLLAILYGLYAQYDENYVKEYEEYLDRFFDNFVVGIWNHMAAFDSKKKDNSLNMNAMLLMIILQGMTEATINGGVSETQFYYEEFRTRIKNNMNMPSYWSNIRITHIGMNQDDNYFTRNNTLYIASTN